MFTRLLTGCIWTMAVLVGAALLTGCEQKDSQKPAKPSEQPKPVTPAVPEAEEPEEFEAEPEAPEPAEEPGAARDLTAEELEAKLAKADALDGQVDKTIHKCAMCALHMEGNAEHASQHAGYTLHFCSEDCKQRFDVDPRHELVVLVVPEKDEE